ncbi:FbpB family small basic protein [Bacillus sp. AK128]
MRKSKKRSFQELVLENKRQLLNDKDALERIEDRIEQKRLGKAE